MNKINWKVRFHNPTWAVSFISAIVVFVYQILGMLGVVPAVSEELVLNLVLVVVNVLVAAGIIVDPTTRGIGDSTRAQQYKKPN